MGAIIFSALWCNTHQITAAATTKNHIALFAVVSMLSLSLSSPSLSCFLSNMLFEKMFMYLCTNWLYILLIQWEKKINAYNEFCIFIFFFFLIFFESFHSKKENHYLGLHVSECVCNVKRAKTKEQATKEKKINVHRNEEKNVEYTYQPIRSLSIMWDCNFQGVRFVIENTKIILWYRYDMIYHKYGSCLPHELLKYFS